MSKSYSEMTSSFTTKTPLLGVIILMVVVGGLVVDADKAEQENFYSDIIRLEHVATKIHQNYVEDVGSKDLVDEAIEGMLEILDPHTSYFEEKQYEELRIHTEGQFGGLGIQISIRDKMLTVMTPIAGTPASRAGIQSGDQIVKIDGKPTKGITVDQAVGKLRGAPGSEVTISIRRKGEKQDVDYTVTREIIHIKSVPFAGVLDNDIGYIRLLTFSQDAGDEIERGVRELMTKNIKGLILDLRHNPGGLLPQAIEVSEKFLPKGSLVVSTRGRVRGQNKEYEAASSPVLPDNIPVVVLVNYASASASEIVAGAIQDWDRGVVIGDTTFGKGSVQSVLPLDPTHHLKLTTAFYYTPSGRCINKPENEVRGRKDEGEPEMTMEGEEGADEVEAPDSAAIKKKAASVDTAVYKTRNGRLVYGGGGIIPDTVVEAPLPPFALQVMYGKDVFFKFANIVYPKLKTKGVSVAEKSFKVDDAMAREFYSFLDTLDFKVESYTQLKFGDFKKRVGLEVKAPATEKGAPARADSSAAEPEEPELKFSDAEQLRLKAISAQIDSLLLKASERMLQEHEVEVRNNIYQALLVRELGQDDDRIYRLRLDEDVQVQAAIKLLHEKNSYAKLLSPSRQINTATKQ
jgi:carboxyl-terminal processing protease